MAKSSTPSSPKKPTPTPPTSIRLGALIVCVAAPLCAADGVDEGRVVEQVLGHECVDAGQIIHLPDGVIRRGYPYEKLALTTYWMPPGSAAGAFRLRCSTADFLVNTDALPFVARAHPLVETPAGPEWNHANVQFGVTWRIPEAFRSRIEKTVLRHIDARNEGRFVAAPPQVYPWADPTGDPELVLDAHVRVPTVLARGPGAHAQFNFMLYLLDTRSGKFFSYIVNLYAHPSEAMRPPRVDNDGEFAFISAQMPRDGTAQLDMRHFRRAPDSRGSSATPWTDSRFFRICIGREHLARAVADLNRSEVPGARGFSSDASHYLLTGAGVIQEHVVHRGESVVMASSTHDFAVSISRARHDALASR